MVATYRRRKQMRMGEADHGSAGLALEELRNLVKPSVVEVGAAVSRGQEVEARPNEGEMEQQVFVYMPGSDIAAGDTVFGMDREDDSLGNVVSGVGTPVLGAHLSSPGAADVGGQNPSGEEELKTGEGFGLSNAGGSEGSGSAPLDAVLGSVGGGVGVRGDSGGERRLTSQVTDGGSGLVADSWAEKVRKHNRSLGSTLDYNNPLLLDGKKKAVFTRAELEKGARIWNLTLVVHVVGGKPFFPHFLAWARRSWRPSGAMNLFSRDNGFFLARFGEEADCKRILEAGPWSFDGRPVIMKRWHQNMKLEKEVLSSLPIWVRFPNLPVQFWNREGVSKIASVIGKPLYADQATASMSRLSFARMYIEVRADEEWYDEIEIKIEDGDSFFQKVEYEWRPARCSICCCFGHNSSRCSAAKEWKEKASESCPSVMAAVATGGLSATPTTPVGGGGGERSGRIGPYDGLRAYCYR